MAQKSSLSKKIKRREALDDAERVRKKLKQSLKIYEIINYHLEIYFHGFFLLRLEI